MSLVINRGKDNETFIDGLAVYDEFPVYTKESYCRVCPNYHFKSSDDFYNHHKAHIQEPKVVHRRLEEGYIKELTSPYKRTYNLRPRPRRELAKKHTQSHSPIKLTLNLASGSTSSHRSLEIVPHTPRPTVVFGPGDNEYSEEASVEGSIEAGERLGSLEESTERPGDRSTGVEESANGVQENLGAVEQTRQEEILEGDDSISEDSYYDAEGSEEEEKDNTARDSSSEDSYQDAEENDTTSDEVGLDLDTGAKLLEAVCQETTDSLNREFSDSNGSNSLDAPNPTPSKQLQPDFLLAAASPAPSKAPAMVKQPQLSPDAPTNADNSGEPSDLEKTADDVGGLETTSFQESGADVGEPISTPSQVIDPLQLPGVQPTTVVQSTVQLTLGSEYDSLDRLGDSAFLCDICGEQASSKEMFDEHRNKAGHYKCLQPECGNKMFPNSEELFAHLRNSHSAQFPPPMVMVQPTVQQLQQQVFPNSDSYSAQFPQPTIIMYQLPVEQLQQVQVQHMPTLQPQSYLTQVPSPNVPPLGPMIQGAMPPPSFANDASQQPPPLYNLLLDNPVEQQQQYDIAALNQMYGQQQQQYRPVALQFQQPLRQQTYMQPSMQHQHIPLLQQQPRLKQHQRGQKRSAALPQTVSPQVKQRRLKNDSHLQQRRSLPESIMHLPEAITLSARQPNPSAVAVTPIPKKQSNAKAMANVLASRDVTITLARNSNSVQCQAQRQDQRPSQAGASLNLNSATSIVATGNSSQQGFAVPQNRSWTVNQVERPARPGTVDLTGDTPMSRGGQNMRGGRMPGQPPGVFEGPQVCQLCGKAFSTKKNLKQHMSLHQVQSYRCNLCAAQYLTKQDLMQHQQSYHEPEMALPLVDVKQPGVLQQLANLGIAHYIPLSQLSSPQGGHFGLPIVSLDGARDPAVSNLSDMGASNILSLGPLKPLQQ